MTNVVRLISPGRNEGLDGNVRDLQMALVRAEIRKKIETASGQVNRMKAHNIAVKYHMCATTVIKFAYGDTKSPSSWTIQHMSKEAGFRVVLMPLDVPLPVGSHELK